MGSLEVTHERDENLNATIVRPSGEIDIFTYLILRESMKNILDAGSERRVVVDLSNTTHIASSGWAVLLTQARAMKLAGGRLVLANMKDQIYGVYRVMCVESQLLVATDATRVKAMLDGNN